VLTNEADEILHVCIIASDSEGLNERKFMRRFIISAVMWTPVTWCGFTVLVPLEVPAYDLNQGRAGWKLHEQ